MIHCENVSRIKIIPRAWQKVRICSTVVSIGNVLSKEHPLSDVVVLYNVHNVYIHHLNLDCEFLRCNNLYYLI